MSATPRGEVTERDLQVRCIALYETPLAVALLPDRTKANKALAERIQATARNDVGQTDWGFGAGDPQVNILGDRLRAIAAPMTGMPNDPAAWTVACRATHLSPGAGIAVQSHPGAFWAATYIVDDGGAAANPALGAMLEFQDPRGAAPVMYAPQFTFAAPGAETLGVSQTLQLAGGGLAVYPAWLLCGMSPYQGPGRHLSLTFTLGKAA